MWHFWSWVKKKSNSLIKIKNFSQMSKLAFHWNIIKLLSYEEIIEYHLENLQECISQKFIKSVYRVNGLLRLFPPLVCMASTCGVTPSQWLYMRLGPVGVCMCDCTHLDLGDHHKRVAHPGVGGKEGEKRVVASLSLKTRKQSPEGSKILLSAKPWWTYENWIGDLKVFCNVWAFSN